MDYEEIVREYLKYIEHISEKIKKYHEENGKPAVLDYDFLELSGFDFSKVLFYVNSMQHTRRKLFDPTIIFQDNPEMLLTYYLIEGKELFIDVDEATFVAVNGDKTVSLDTLYNDERMKRLYKVVCNNKDLKEKVIHNTINYFIEYYDFLLSNYSYTEAITECINSIYELLIMEEVSFEDAKYLYENIVSKHDQFKSIDYDGLIRYRPEFLSVPGFIDNITANGLMEYFRMLMENQEDFSEESVCDIFKDIYDSNKDRPDSIRHLVTIIRELDDDKELEEQLCNKYPEFKAAFGNDDKTLDEAKAIFEGKNIDVANPVDLSKNEFFRENLDQMIKSYLNNGAVNEEISLAILMALARNLRDSKGLEYDVVINTKAVDTNTLGYYNNDDGVLYINPSHVKPGKEYFIYNVSTIFHEVQHALQNQKIFESDDYSYTNLTMITDSLLSRSIFSPYYTNNYNNIAFEIDARSAQLSETLKFIDQYCPEMRESFKENFLKNVNLTDAKVRKDLVDYSTSLQLFLEREEVMGSVRKEYLEGDDKSDGEREYTLEEIDRYKRLFLKFPVFEYDEKEYRIKLKSEEEIINIRKQYEEAHDEVGLDLIDNVLYDIKLAKFLDGKLYGSLDEAIEKSREGLGGM